MLQIPRLSFLIALVFVGIVIAQTGYGNNGGGPNECLEPPVDDPDDPRPSADYIWADWPDCEWVLAVALTSSASQGYPAADISPDICLNAQSEYTTTKFDVSIGLDPDNATATVSKESGDISLENETTGDTGDSITVNDDEVVVVTGNTKGSYQIKITHDVDTTKSKTYEGMVFEFKFSDLVVTNSTNNISGSSSSSSLSGNKLTAYTSTMPGSSGQYSGGTFERHFELEVVTDPSGAFTGDVIAGARVNQKYSYDILLRKGRAESGTSSSVSVSAGLLSYSWGSNGSKACCGYGMDYWVKKHGEQNWTKWDIMDQNTDVITWSWLDLTPFKTERYTEDDYSVSTDDLDRTYTVGTSKFDFRITVGAATKSNNAVISGAFGGSGAQSGSNSYVEAHISDFNATEKDSTYEIQPQE